MEMEQQQTKKKKKGINIVRRSRASSSGLLKSDAAAGNVPVFTLRWLPPPDTRPPSSFTTYNFSVSYKPRDGGGEDVVVTYRSSACTQISDLIRERGLFVWRMRRLTVVAAEQKPACSHAWTLRGLWDGKEATEDSPRKATWRVDKTQTFIILAR